MPASGRARFDNADAVDRIRPTRTALDALLRHRARADRRRRPHPGRGGAEEALAAAERLEPRDAVVRSPGADGHVELRQTRQTGIGEGAIAGGTIGLLAGLLVGLPIAAAVIGLAGGGGFGIRDT